MIKKRQINSRVTTESLRRTSILIRTNNLNCKTKYNLNIILKSKKRVILKGIVCNTKQEPSIGAAIEVIEVDCRNNARKIIGYSYTDNKGKYLFSIEVLPYMFYEITVYSPLNT